MKKIIAAALTLFATTIVYAQTPLDNEAFSTAENYPGSRRGAAYSSLPPYSINIKAVRNFYDRYCDNNSETWYATDYGFPC